jgi:hypothetical protein
MTHCAAAAESSDYWGAVVGPPPGSGGWRASTVPQYHHSRYLRAGVLVLELVDVGHHAVVRFGVLPAPVASQSFLTNTDVTQVNLSHNGRLKGRSGRRTQLAGQPGAPGLNGPAQSAGGKQPQLGVAVGSCACEVNHSWKPAAKTASYRVAVGIKTAGIRWRAATTATQQLAVLTHRGRTGCSARALSSSSCRRAC